MGYTELYRVPKNDGNVGFFMVISLNPKPNDLKTQNLSAPSTPPAFPMMQEWLQSVDFDEDPNHLRHE